MIITTLIYVALVKDLLSDCFATMRGNVLDMLPAGWELASSQILADLDPDLLLQREREFFVCVDGAIYSKEFAVKAQAMKTVSLGSQVITSLHSLTNTSIAILFFFI